MDFKEQEFVGNLFAAFLIGGIFSLGLSCKDKRPAPAPFDNSSGLTEEPIPELGCTTESPCTYQITGIFLNLGGLCSNVVHNAPMPVIAARDQLDTIINSDRNTSDLSCFSCPNNVEVQDGLTSPFKIVGFTYTETKIDNTQESKSMGETSDTHPKTCDAAVPDPDTDTDPDPTPVVPPACLNDAPGLRLGIDPITGIFAHIDTENGGTDDRCNHLIQLGSYDPTGYNKNGVVIYYSCVADPANENKARWQCGLTYTGDPR